MEKKCLASSDTVNLPKVIFNDDGINFINSHDNAGLDSLKIYLGRYARKVDLVSYCVSACGLCFYDTEIGEPYCVGFGFTDRVYAYRRFKNLLNLAKEGGYLKSVFSILKEYGVKTMASIRINDMHGSHDITGPNGSRIWHDHPKWHIGGATCYARAFDYENYEVRQFVKLLVMEIAEKFPDIDGIELDAMRCPVFFEPGSAREKSELLTTFILEIRSELDKFAAKLGRIPYLLSMNVPRSPEAALDCGIDIKAICEKNVLSWISPGCYFTEMMTPIDEWRSILSENTPIYLYMNCNTQSGVYMNAENYRAAAINAYAQGAAGVNVFNMPCFDEICWTVPVENSAAASLPPVPEKTSIHAHIPETWNILDELGSTEKLDSGRKHYQFYMERKNEHEWSFPFGPRELRREIGIKLDLPFVCLGKEIGVSFAEMRVKITDISINDKFCFFINGIAVEPMKRLHSFNGRDTRVFPSSLPPFSMYHIELPPELLKPDKNVLTVEVTGVEESLLSKIMVRDLEVLTGEKGKR